MCQVRSSCISRAHRDRYARARAGARGGGASWAWAPEPQSLTPTVTRRRVTPSRRRSCGGRRGRFGSAPAQQLRAVSLAVALPDPLERSCASKTRRKPLWRPDTALQRSRVRADNWRHQPLTLTHGAQTMYKNFLVLAFLTVSLGGCGGGGSSSTTTTTTTSDKNNAGTGAATDFYYEVRVTDGATTVAAPVAPAANTTVDVNPETDLAAKVLSDVADVPGMTALPTP